MGQVARFLAIAAMAGRGIAFAQTYPSHPIKVVVPWPPGQATDTVARVVTVGIKASRVPYKGSAPGTTDLTAGRVTYAFETAGSVVPRIKSGRLKAFAVSSPPRSIIIPALPTIIEARSVAGFDVRAWIGLSG